MEIRCRAQTRNPPREPLGNPNCFFEWYCQKPYLNNAWVCYSPSQTNRRVIGIISIGSERDQLLFSRSRVFYGWRIVAIAAVGLFFSEPAIAVYSYSVFLKAVSQDFRVGEPLLWSPLLWLSLWLWLFQL